MKTRLLFILLFLGGVLFFGCKKDKPNNVHSVALISDSITGTYIVSGSYLDNYLWHGVNLVSTGIYTNDTVIITKDSAGFVVMNFERRDSVWHDFISPELSPGTTNSSFIRPPDSTHYYNFTYSGSDNNYNIYQLSFPKNHIDSIYIIQTDGYVPISSDSTYLSGIKIH